MAKRTTAIRVCAFLALLLVGSVAGAAPIGRVSDSSGVLLAKTASGSIKILAAGSAVELGASLLTRADTYARVTLSDQSSVTLGPDTELTIEKYYFHEHEHEPEPTDTASMRLVKGRVRITSGAIGARGTNAFILSAGAATIDIQHSTFIAEYQQRGATDVASREIELRNRRATMLSARQISTGFRYVSLRLAQNVGGGPSIGGLNPGLYVQVIDGMINVKNGGGSQNFTAGQFGFTGGFNQPPVILPNNPGLQFTPPPSFSNTTGGTQNGNGGGKPGDVDCIVR